MEEQDGGVIANAAYKPAYIGSPDMSAYIASKNTIAGLTKTAAVEEAEIIFE